MNRRGTRNGGREGERGRQTGLPPPLLLSGRVCSIGDFPIYIGDNWYIHRLESIRK